MKKFILEKTINFIKGSDKKYTNEEIAVIRYGLESMYLTITKLVIITLLAYLLGILKEYLIVLFLFNGIRMFAFGLHASKSIYCLVYSILLFIGLPILCSNIIINIYIKIVLLVICIWIYILFAPSDTKKRPIVNKKRRIFYKTMTIITSLIYSYFCITTASNFISNAILFTMIAEAYSIHPLIYKLFNMPYNNYKTYLNKVNS